MNMITITLPEPLVWLILVVFGLHGLVLILDVYLKYLKWRLGK